MSKFKKWTTRLLSFSLCLILMASLLKTMVMPAMAAVINLEYFDYNSSTYYNSLAERCAEYAMLAYDDMGLKNSRYYDLKLDKNKRDQKGENPPPVLLINKLGANGDKFNNIVHHNYNDVELNNVSYVLANKQVMHNGVQRTLVAVIIRGTDSEEWLGNMDITGTSYDHSYLFNHYSFMQAEFDLRTDSVNGLTTYISDNNITNPLYLITGHSRGAAVANLLADTLSEHRGSHNVFAYTFATPNVTRFPNGGKRPSIFNFCFNDDFVPQVPLSDWGYGKHGTTYTQTVESLYNNFNNTGFVSSMDNFIKDTKTSWIGLDVFKLNLFRNTPTFNSAATNNMLSAVRDKAKNTYQFYNLKYPTGGTPLHELMKESLYDYFRNCVAPAAMGETSQLMGKWIGVDYFSEITKFFINGSGMLLFNDYIFDTHHAFTYYAAIKHRLFESRHMIDARAANGGTVSGGGYYYTNEYVLLGAKQSSGYTFDGWYEKGVKLSSSLYYVLYASKDRIIEARFNPIQGQATPPPPQAHTYTVSFHANGGAVSPASLTGSSVRLPTPTSSPTVTLTFNADGGSVSPVTMQIPRRFGGWYTASGTKAGDAGETYVPTADQILYAGWYEEARIGDAGFLPTPTKAGHTFRGWYEGSRRVEEKDSISKNTTIKADWLAEIFTITFNSNGGSFSYNGSPDTLLRRYSPKYHGTSMKITVEHPERHGYTFFGWSEKDSNGKFIGREYVTGNYITQDRAMTLYAIWGGTISFDLRGGRTATGNNTTIPSVGPSETRYGFQLTSDHELENHPWEGTWWGWSTSKDGSTGTYRPGIPPYDNVWVSQDTTLYAVYRSTAPPIPLPPPPPMTTTTFNTASGSPTIRSNTEHIWNFTPSTTGRYSFTIQTDGQNMGYGYLKNGFLGEKSIDYSSSWNGNTLTITTGVLKAGTEYQLRLWIEPGTNSNGSYTLTRHQSFASDTVSDGIYRIRNVSTGQYLGVNGTTVGTQPSNTAQMTQYWKIQRMTDESNLPYSITSLHNEQVMNRISNASIQTTIDSAATDRRWRIYNQGGQINILPMNAFTHSLKGNATGTDTFDPNDLQQYWELEKIPEISLGKSEHTFEENEFKWFTFTAPSTPLSESEYTFTIKGSINNRWKIYDNPSNNPIANSGVLGNNAVFKPTLERGKQYFIQISNNVSDYGHLEVDINELGHPITYNAVKESSFSPGTPNWYKFNNLTGVNTIILTGTAIDENNISLYKRSLPHTFDVNVIQNNDSTITMITSDFSKDTTHYLKLNPSTSGNYNIEVRSGRPIITEEELQNIGVGNYFLMKDITLTEDFTPINYFGNTLNGNGYAIINLNINQSNEDNIGLFKQNNGVIQNLIIKNANIVGGSNVGVIAGNNHGTIRNCKVIGVVNGQGNNIGGLIGENHGNVQDSIMSGNINGTDNTGGLVGINRGMIIDSISLGTVIGTSNTGGLVATNNGTITNSHFTGAVTGTTVVGGLVGLNHYSKSQNIFGTITRSSAQANVTATGNFSGGLIGDNLGRVDDSDSGGTINGQAYIGGLIGFNRVDGNVTNSSSSVDVVGRDRSGGFVGSNTAIITTSYSTGNVEGQNNVGGFVGRHDNGSISYSYSTGDVKSMVNFAGGFIGYMGGTSASIDQCYATSNITRAVNEMGGFLGRGESSSIVISNSFAVSKMPLSTNSAGFAGFMNGTIEYSYAVSNGLKGFVGTGEPTVINSYFDIDIGGADEDNGRPTLQMYDIDTYEEWDNDVWNFSGTDYPMLKNIEGTPGFDKLVAPLALRTSVSSIVRIGKQDWYIFTPDISGSHTFTTTGAAVNIEIFNQNGDSIAEGNSSVLAGYLNDNETYKIRVLGNNAGSYMLRADEGTPFILGSDETFTIENNTTNWHIVKPSVSGYFTIAAKGTATTSVELYQGNTQITPDYVNTGFDDNFRISLDLYAGVTYNLKITGNSSGEYALESYEGYIILKPEDLMGINNMSTQYTLMNDIDLNGGSLTPIGTLSEPFTGIFDGNGHTISNFKITKPNDDNVGFFGNTVGTVKNLTISNATVTGKQNVGILAGNASDTITNCAITGSSSVTGYGDNVGGLIGYNQATVSSSFAQIFQVLGGVNSSGTRLTNGVNTSHTGGLIGDNRGNVNDSLSSGQIRGILKVGGLIGMNSSNLTNSNSSASVNVIDSRAGGLVGDNLGTISNSYSTGTITGGHRAGGLVGDHRGGVVIESYATGIVSGQDRVGGFIGTLSNNAIVDKSYATGKATGNLHAGGFIGRMENGFVIRSNSSGNVKGLSDNVGGFVGQMDNGIIDRCYSDSALIEGGINMAVGGFIGRGDTSSVSISNSSAKSTFAANIALLNNGNSAGFSGYMTGGTISNCFAVSNNARGFFGNGDGNVENSYFDNSFSGNDSKTGVIGKTMAEMKMQSTFVNVGWNFDDIWEIKEEITYPTHRNMISPIFEKSMLTGITGTKRNLQTLLEEFETSDNHIEIYDWEDNAIDITTETKTATGMKIVKRSNFSNAVVEVKFVVIFGDLNGDGIVDSDDRSLMRSSMRINNIFALAADLRFDGEIDLFDIIRMRDITSPYDESNFNNAQNIVIQNVPDYCKFMGE